MRSGAPDREVREGLRAEGKRFAILVSRFNGSITDELLDGSRRCLMAHGVREEDIDIFGVPGSWELPQAARRIAALQRYDAIIPLGCVIRGETRHFDFVAGEAAFGLGAVARESPIPIVFGVLATESVEQARERADPARGNGGWQAALAALEMANLFDDLDPEAH